jgi:hypothetical protein
MAEENDDGSHGRARAQGGSSRATVAQTPQNRNFKNTDFVDTIVSKVLRDLPFSRNQPLKSADD